MKNGLMEENGVLVYYKNDRLYHAGAIEVDGDIYYIGSKGHAAKGVKVVHGEMTNGILKRGTYTFGEDYKLIPGSYVAPKKRKKKLLKSWAMWRTWAPGACLVLIVLLVGLGLYEHMQGKKDVQPEERMPTTEEMREQIQAHRELQIVLPEFEEPVLLCSQPAREMYLNNLDVENCVNAGTAYRSFQFDYDLDDQEGRLIIREMEDPANVRIFDLPPQYSSIAVENLKTGTAYAYEVEVADKVFTGSFETEESTRFLSIPGIANTRDIGGYRNQDGQMVKQGMIIRGSELDGLALPSYFLNEEDVEDVRSTFGFVHEMDLRGASIYGGVYQSRLGEDVSHYFYGAPQYGEIFSRTYQAALREIFTDLADPHKYPMYMHCTYGADRTGTIVFLLQGLLNMSEEDMVREYRMTGFTTASYRKSVSMDVVISGLQAYEGDTLQEKIVSFLTQNVGISPEQIQSIRNIMLEQ